MNLNYRNNILKKGWFIMKKVNLIRIFISILVVLIFVIGCNINEKYNTDSRLNITFLDDNIGTLEFDIVYSAPHLSHVRAFRFKSENGIFNENDNFVYGIQGYINVIKVNSIFQNDINTLEDKYGQAALMRKFGDSYLLAFDGWRLTEFESETKQYTVLKSNGESTEIFVIETAFNFYAIDLIEYKSNYYLISHITDFTDVRGDYTMNFVLYNVQDGSDMVILSTKHMLNLENITLIGDYLVTTYHHSVKNEHLFVYNLDTFEVVVDYCLSEHKNNIDNNFEKIVLVDNEILIFYNQNNNRIGIIKTNLSFEVVKTISINVKNYQIIKNIISYCDKVYILTSIDGNAGILSEYIYDTNESRVLIEFTLSNNKEGIFLSDIIFQ